MTPEPSQIPVGHTVARTRAEGPGERYALWVQGCPLRCPGCCNPELLPFAGGRAVATDDLVREILAEPGLEGLSLLGGEPFAHAAPLARLAVAVRARGLSVMVYSGYRRDELAAMATRGEPGVAELLAATDLLVDGRYDRTRPDTRRRWIGSTNQVLHFLTARYAPDDPAFLAPNTVEIRFDPATRAAVIHGWPALAAELVRR